MTALEIRIRETRVDLSHADGALRRLILTVPREPLKLDRGTVIFPWHLRNQDCLIVKVYGEMGVFNRLRKQIVGYRARREFQTLAWLREMGVACCEPIFWGTGRSTVHGLFEAVATREIPGARTLAELAPCLPPAARAELLGKLFESLAQVHRAGVFHGAFYPTNVLLGNDPGTTNVPWLVDLEKSVRFAYDIRGSRMANFDLVCAVRSTLEMRCNSDVRGALARYGLEVDAIERLIATVKRTRSSKFRRYRHRAEFLARGVVSRLTGGGAASLRAAARRDDAELRCRPHFE